MPSFDRVDDRTLDPGTRRSKADSLAAGAMKRPAEIFAEERAKLEGQRGRDESVSTQDLRLALRRYRSFFGRLLSVYAIPTGSQMQRS